MKARFLEVAEAELMDAVEYYDGEALGLGDRLVAEVRATVELLEKNPEIGAVVRGALRNASRISLSVHDLLRRRSERDPDPRSRSSPPPTWLLVEAVAAVSEA